MPRLTRAQKHKILRNVYRNYISFKDHVTYRRDKGDEEFITAGTHADDCPFWERIDPKVPKNKRNLKAPCTCGFLEEGPLMLSLSDLKYGIEQLAPRKKEAFFYNVILDWSQDETAKKMGITTVSVGQYIDAACDQLAQRYFAEDNPKPKDTNTGNSEKIIDED